MRTNGHLRLAALLEVGVAVEPVLVEPEKTAGRLHDVDPTVAAYSVLGMVLWLPRWFRQGGRLDQEAVANAIAEFALGGLLAPARREPTKLTVSRRRF